MQFQRFPLKLHNMSSYYCVAPYEISMHPPGFGFILLWRVPGDFLSCDLCSLYEEGGG